MVEIVTKDRYIVPEINIRQSSPDITDAKRVGIVRLVQAVVDEIVKQLRYSKASLPYSILYEEGRRKLPVDQDKVFCVFSAFSGVFCTIFVGRLVVAELAKWTVCQQCRRQNESQ